MPRRAADGKRPQPSILAAAFSIGNLRLAQACKTNWLWPRRPVGITSTLSCGGAMHARASRPSKEISMDHAELTLRDQAQPRQVSLDEYWMPFTPNRDFKADPKMVVRAEGMYYWNDRGEKLIDASPGMFCVNAGHGRKEIAEAVHRQLIALDFIAPVLRGHPKSFDLAA